MAETPNFKVRIVPTFDGLPSIMQPIIDQAAVVSVVSEVVQEIWAARSKHGKQHDLPLGFDGRTGSILNDLAWARSGRRFQYLENDELEALAKQLCEDEPTWAHILFEEVAEALAAEPDEVRAELIQVAAMAVGAVIAHDAQRSAS